MKVQYAMDGLLDECLEKAERYRDRLDVIEIGEKIIYHESQNIIPKIKEMFSDKKVVVDLKFMDGGYNFSKEMFALGADIVTVCATADRDCLEGVIKAAREDGKEAWLDLIGIEPRFYKNYVDISNELGFDYVCAHFSGPMFRDEPGIFARKDSILLFGKLPFNAKKVVSGKMTTEYIPEMKEAKIDVVNLGSIINRSLNADSMLERFRAV